MAAGDLLRLALPCFVLITSKITSLREARTSGKTDFDSFDHIAESYNKNEGN